MINSVFSNTNAPKNVENGITAANESSFDTVADEFIKKINCDNVD